jgi:hypothetical protein
MALRIISKIQAWVKNSNIYWQYFVGFMFMSIPLVLFLITFLAEAIDLFEIAPISLILITLGPCSLVTSAFVLWGYFRAVKLKSHTNKQVAGFLCVFCIMGAIAGALGLIFISMIR